MQLIHPAPAMVPHDTATTKGLGAGEFHNLMARFVPPPTGLLALAVSGGPDSMALAFLAKNWCAASGLQAPIAFIIDHALRPESGAEAETVKTRLETLGLQAKILRWQHEPIVSRLHHEARRARYRLLLDACHSHGATTLLFGHQREDQAETVLMRLAKGTGIDGLAGMPAEIFMGNVRVLRPLLAVAKEKLVATCADAGLSYVTDPSNVLERFARGRLRRVMPLLHDEGLTVERLNDFAERAGEARQALDHFTGEFLKTHAGIDAFGCIAIDRDALLQQPRAIALRVLSLSLQSIHAEDYAPAHASLSLLLDFLKAEKIGAYRTLNGCMIGTRKNRVTMFREYAAITDTCLIRPGETVLWDGRWQVTLSPDFGAPDFPAGSYEIRTLGYPPQKKLDAWAPGLRRKVQQGRVRSTLPAIWAQGEIIAVPFGTAQKETQAELMTKWPVFHSRIEN